MRNEAVETEEVGQFRVNVVLDSDPRNPREDDNMGRFVLTHRRYNLGDSEKTLGFSFNPDHFDGWDEAESWLVETVNPVLLRRVSMYDHGGITISFGSPTCRFDSGYVGWAYITREQLEWGYGKKTVETWSPEQLMKAADRVLDAELEVYDAYLRGDVYGFVVEEQKGCDHCGRAEWEEVESCWGFYNSDEAMTEGKSTAEAIIRRRAEKQAAQVQQ